jgi:uncharacterized repeat protein (TIGR03803 family)
MKKNLLVVLGIFVGIASYAQNISTIAGGGIGDGGSAITASLSDPANVAIDASGNIYLADHSNNRIRKITASTGIITTVAGNGTASYSGDGSAAIAAGLNNPWGVAVDATGNIYIADYANNRIRKVTVSTGIITTVAGIGTPGYSGDGSAATSAGLYYPTGVAVDASGNIYIADSYTQRIRKVSVGTGIITTVAGNGTPSYSGDGSTATSASLMNPRGVALDAAGNIYIADCANQRIRKVTAASGIITTIAGNGTAGYSGDGSPATSAGLLSPFAVAVDTAGNIYIADKDNYRIRKVGASNGIITTLAGNGIPVYSGDGSSATLAGLCFPTGVAVDISGNTYIAEYSSQRIRKVTAASGIISTLAGNGTTTWSGDGGAAESSGLNMPYGVTLDASGNLYIADQSNQRIRKVSVSTGIITTVAGNGTAGYSGDGGAATSAGLYNPSGVAIDASGNIYIADKDNSRIRKVTASNGIITTVAGNGSMGFSGDGSAATSAGLYNPFGIAVDASGNIFIADIYNNRIRKVTVGTGIITTIAGNGTYGYSGDGSAAIAAGLYNPSSVALDASGNIYIADGGNQRIRKVTTSTGIITTVAGNGTAIHSGDGSAATSAGIAYPSDVAVDASGNIYITDQSSHRIRMVTASTGIITTVAGNGTAGYSGDGGAAASAQLYSPVGSTVDALGNIYIADKNNQRIRKVAVLVASTITTSSVSPSNCAGSFIRLPYTISGTFNAGNIFTAQLSDVTGSFASPVSIGTKTSTASDTIFTIIPGGSPGGSAYRIRVVSSNPFTTGTDNGSNITINALPAITTINTTVSNATGFIVTPVNGSDGSVPAGTTYSWGIPAVTGGLTGGTSGTDAVSITGTLTNPTQTDQTATYTVTPTSGGCVGSTFTVIVAVSASPPPAINSFTPTSGSIGTLVTITGTNLTNPTVFTVGGVPAIVISNDGSTLVGMIMPGTTSGNISLTTAGGTASSGGNFTVTATVPPTMQQGSKLVGTDTTGGSLQGSSVALSADGNTAVIGGPSDNSSMGAAWIYTRSGEFWTQQGNKLVGTGAIGTSVKQGQSVAISADGNTVLVGGPYDNTNVGAVWVYSRSGGVWTQQGDKLIGTGASGSANQGYSVSLSADGNTAVVGGAFDDMNVGAIWIFTRTGNVWTQEGGKLVGSDAIGSPNLGFSVSISSDGNNVIAGGRMDNNHAGAAWVYTRTAGVWTQQGSKLVGTGSAANSAFQGCSVGMSSDGNTAIVGGFYENMNNGDYSGSGAVWIYTRSGGIWTQQGNKLIGTGAAGQTWQGWSVSISSDGNIAYVGGYYDNASTGAVWVYTRSGGIWTQYGSKLVGTGYIGSPQMGSSLALSADASTALVGGWYDNYNAGAAWVFTPPPPTPPVITSFTPSSGSVGSLVTLTGTALNNPTTFTIGGIPAIVISGDSSTLVGMVMPGATSGNISITTAGGLATSAGNFTVTPSHFPIAQQGNKLIDTSIIGPSYQAYSVSLSADGNTAITGGIFDNSGIGSACIYTRSGNSWIRQGSKLVASDNIGNSQQGFSVSLSADGNTALVGGHVDNSGIGAAWIYTRTGSTWTQQGGKLISNDYTGSPFQGQSVSLSADGNTALVGGYNDQYGMGAAWIYTRSNGTWTQQGSKLVGTGNTGASNQGSAVALSADGKTAIICGNSDNNQIGAAWIFTLSGGTWTQQGSKLVGAGYEGIPIQGNSASLSSNGNTAIVGGYYDNTGIGAAWIFTRNNSTWSQQGSKLVALDYSIAPNQGMSVSISADGNTALIGGHGDQNNIGATWVYTRNDTIWTQQGSKLVGSGYSGNSEQGISVSLSADGTTALIGGYGDNSYAGAAWIFTPLPPTPPAITSFTPSSGSIGTLVTISGTAIINPTAFTIGGVDAIIISKDSSTLVGMVMPGATSGNISITTSGGTASSSGTFTVTASVLPSAQQGSKLAGTDNVGNSEQGFSVSLSADGNTAIVGGHRDNTDIGAAWIYTRSGNTWTQQGSKLVGTDYTGSAWQGCSVSISADGNTALVGGQHDNGNIGAVWIYTRNGGVWTQQGNKLVGTGYIGTPYQGNAGSLSADGNTALIGGYVDNSNKGAAWIFTRSGNIWTQQGGKLVGNDFIGNSNQGQSVSLSADGNTAIIGGFGDNGTTGASWIYVRKGNTWVQQGNKLVGTGNIGISAQGASVSLSANGNTAITGGFWDNTNIGAAWIFTRIDSTWTQQGSKLVGNDNVGESRQGFSVAISADGNTALIGGTSDNNNIGASWLYTRTGNSWSQKGSKLVGTGITTNSEQGSSVSLSADGSTALVGGHFDNSWSGSAWVFTVLQSSVASAATNLISTGFTANWSASASATGYILDVDDTVDFSSPVINKLDVANILAKDIIGLTSGTLYYYRVRAYNGNDTGGYSNVITLTTLQTQTISFSALVSKTYGDVSFTLSATGGSSGNPVTFTSKDTTIAKCTGANGEILTILKAGIDTIYADQQGNGSFAAATRSGQALTVNAKAISVTVDAGQSKIFGFTDPVFTYSLTPSLESGDSFTGSLSRAAGENTGFYAISLGTLDAGPNYIVTFVPDNFVISAIPVSTSALNTSYCVGSAISVPFTISGSYNAGNVFSAELSDATGSFGSPINIGNLFSTTAGTIDAVIPSGSTPGTSYRIRVVTSDPVYTGNDNGSDIAINALQLTPTVSPDGPTTFCTGGSVNLISSAGGAYLWSTAETTSFVNVSTSGSYSVQVTDANGCQSLASATAVVTVNPLPIAPDISAGGPISFCAGGNVNLTSSAGSAYLWSTTETTASINVTNTGSYTVQVTDANACQSVPSVSTVVTVNPLPIAPNISAGGPISFCAGGNVNLTSSAGSAYLWSTTETTSSINITNSGSYTVQITDANGCQSAASTATDVTVNPFPAAAGVISGSITVDQGQNSVSYTVPPIADASSYVWTLPSGAIGTSTTNSISVNFGSSAVSGNISVYGNNSCGNGSASSLAVTVNPSSNLPQSHTEFWGLTSAGGQYNTGVIFKTDGSGNNQTVQQSFIQIAGANPVYNNLIQASDGKLYGMTPAGGVNNLGVIYQYNPGNNNYLKKFDFGGANGEVPIGSLMQATDGILYGMTSSGGTNGAGVIFQFDPANSTFTKKIDFDGTNGGQPEGSLMQASDGMLYGMTTGGGVNGYGVIFQYNPITNTYINKFEFDGATNGQTPYEGALIQASDGMLFGMTSQGGTYNDGVIFQFDPTSNNYSKKFDFDGVKGGYPHGSLTQASDGMLYGMTSYGGANSVYGVIFQYDPGNSTYTKKIDFDGANGSTTYGSLIQASDGKLYGMTTNGGPTGWGVIFQFDPSTSTYTKSYDFNTTEGLPQGSLMQASDGKFYAMARGGSYNLGVLFQFDPTSSTYTKKLDFGAAINGNNPQGSLTLASDGKLYGMTHDGGANNLGILLQIDPATSIMTKKLDFDGANNGSNPFGALIQASDGMLYGMTHDGGVNTGGVLFKYDVSSSTYTKILDFEGGIGSHPYGSLIQASDGLLYGMTWSGGPYEMGVIFQFNPASSTYSKMLDFDGTKGGNPNGSLLQALDGKLYGSTVHGGSNGLGALFQFDPASSILTDKFDFDGINGTSPNTSLAQGSDGKLYGMTTAGGTTGYGVLYQFDPTSSSFTKILDFDGATNGGSPIGSLMKSSDGNLYGMTSAGGANNLGVLFQFDPITSTLTKTLDFNGTNGKTPMGSLVEIAVDTFSTSPISNSNCAGSPISVSYSVKNAFNAGNVFTAQLSDITGSFVSPVDIGNITSSVAGTITAVIPSNTTPGNAYRIRVVSNNPVAASSDNGSNITINALPTVTATATLSSLCVGASTTLSGGGATTYVWTAGITDGISFAPATTTTYTVTGTDANSCTNTATQTITVNALPVVTASATLSSLCTGASTTLTGGGATTYVWTGGITNGISFAPATTTTYTVTGTDANSCTNTASQTITVNPLPTVTASATLSSLCVGVSTTLTGGGATSYVWTGGITDGISFSPASSVTYTVTGTDANSCTNTASQTITVNPLPTVTASATLSSLCAGNSTTLTGGGATSYVWTGGITDGISFSPASTASYTVTGTDANSCSNTASQTVTVNPLPTVTASATLSSLCAGASTTLTGGGALSYAWTGGINDGITFAPASTTTYTVTGTDANSCTNTASQTITVNPLPTVTASATLSSLCAGASTTLTGGGALSYAWTGGITDGISFAPASTTTYTVTGTDANSCTNTASQTITVNPLPIVTASATLSSLCAGNSTTLTGGGATTYVWTGGITDGISFAPATTTTYTVTGTDANSCTNTASQTITVNTLPVVTANATLSSLCAGNSTTLTGSGATSYVWTGGITDGISFAPASTTTYVVTGTDANSCTNTASLTITVNPLPTVTASATLSSLCIGASTTLTGGGATTYVWTGGITDGLSFSPASTASYTVTGTDANSCSNTANQTITVNPLPTVTASATLSSLCVGASTTLTGGGATTYVWTGGITDGLSFTPATTTTYTVTGTDANSCTNTASQTITVNTLPVVTASATLSSLCAGASTTLNGGGASTYVWTGGITNGASITPASTTTYTVTGTDANSCSNTASQTITVNPFPAAAGAITGLSTVCQGQLAVTYTLPVNPDATSFVWTLPSGSTGTSSTNSITADYGSLAVSGNITVKGTNSCGDGALSSLAIIVNQKPVTPIISLDGAIFKSDAILGNQWYDQNGLINGAENQYYIASGNGNYYDYVTISGCSSNKSNTLSKNSLCDAQFSYSGAGSVSFTDLSTGNPSGWSWNFGDGTTSSLQNAVHTYTKDGVYTVTLTIFNSQSCMSAVSKDLTVGSVTCQAGFEAIVNSSTGVADFTSTSLNATGYYWDFGGGEYSTDINPQHTYSKAGMYPVCLTISSAACQSMICKNVIYIPQGEKYIHADFSFFNDPNSLTVTFNDLSSSNTTDWYWLMGDGMMLKTQNPVHTYLKPGVYTVYLGVADNINSLAGFKTMEVRVGTIPCDVNSNFSYFIDPVTRDVEFFSKATGSGTEYFWTFGDATTSVVENPIHNFSTPGYYHVSLAVRNSANNCMDEYSQNIQVGSVDCHADFTYTVNPDNNSVKFTDASTGLIDLYAWEFGDGSYSVLQNPDYTYKNPGIYNVGQVVINQANGCTDYTIQPVQVGVINCSANFISCIDPATYTAYFTNDMLGSSTGLTWSFGDGKNSTEQNPVNIFPGPGIYSASLSTFDQTTGCGDYKEEMLVIGSLGIDCNADFVYRVDPLTSDVTFSNTSIGDITGSIWTFGDETDNSIDTNPVHSFTKTGYYSVCLTVINSSGIRNTGCKWVQVNANTDNDCRANFMYTINPDTRAVNFVDKSLGEIDKYTWDFEDGKKSSSSADKNPSYTYGQNGFYLVKLKAENTATGCASNEYKYLNVGAEKVLKAKFGSEARDPNKKFAGYPVDLVSASSGDGATVEWDFGDKQLKKGFKYVMDSTSRIVTHYYQNPGQYEVCLRISDPVSGKSDEFCGLVNTKNAVSVEALNNSDLYLDVYPNPFIDHTTIDYEISDPQFIEIAIFDQLGRRLETLVKAKQEPGDYRINWETKTVATGVYHLKLITEGGIITKQLIITK